MKNKLIILLLMLLPVFLSAEGFRDINIEYHHNLSLQNSSTNFRSVYRLTEDSYYNLIDPILPEWSRSVASFAFTFSATYMNILWSHEFGHWFRAKEIGGSFNIHDISLPVPYTTMSLPDDVTPMETALTVAAGFEVNYLVARDITEDFYFYESMYADELALAFANRIFQTIYVSLIVPINPEDTDFWDNPGGDTAFTLLSVWEWKTGSYNVVEDGVVNPEFVQLYWETVLLTSFLNFLDPTFYQMLKANVAETDEQIEAKWLVQTDSLKWTFSSQFVMSALGYDIYLNQYLKVGSKDLIFYLRYGRPLKNLGAGIILKDLFSIGNMGFTLKSDFWNQYELGWGGLGLLDFSIKVSHKLNITGGVGYKTEGIIPGHPVGETILLSVGLNIQI